MQQAPVRLDRLIEAGLAPRPALLRAVVGNDVNAEGSDLEEMPRRHLVDPLQQGLRRRIEAEAQEDAELLRVEIEPHRGICEERADLGGEYDARARPMQIERPRPDRIPHEPGRLGIMIVNRGGEGPAEAAQESGSVRAKAGRDHPGRIR